MKPSEITAELVANYTRLDYAGMTGAEKAELSAMLAAAKSYVKAYTGQVDEAVTGEALTENDTDSTVFTTRYSPLVKGTLKVYVDGVQKDEEADFAADYAAGEITFAKQPAAAPTADYTAGMDAFEDFTLAVYALCSDMYDNRQMAVENDRVNRVVQSILDMHRVNLL